MIKKVLEGHIKYYKEKIDLINEKIKEKIEEEKRIEHINKLFGNAISNEKTIIEAYEMLRFAYQMTLQELNDLLTICKGVERK